MCKHTIIFIIIITATGPPLLVERDACMHSIYWWPGLGHTEHTYNVMQEGMGACNIMPFILSVDTIKNIGLIN